MRNPNIARTPYPSLCCRPKLSWDFLSVSPCPKSAGVSSQGNADTFNCCVCFEMTRLEVVLTGWNVVCTFGERWQRVLYCGWKQKADMPSERHVPSFYLSKWMKNCITNDVLAVLRLFRHHDGWGFNWFRFYLAWIVVILHKNNFIPLLRAKRLSSRRSSYLCILRRHCQRVVGLYEP